MNLNAWMPLVALLLASVSRAEPVKVKGSDTLAVLVDKWSEEFAKREKGLSVASSGGGTNSGITALLTGTTDIAAASRPLKRSELEKLRMRFKTVPRELKVARDALSFYVNAANPISALTLEQLRGICTGTITNWKEVGGPDAPIVLVAREASSGTNDFLKEALLKKGDFAPNAVRLPGTAAVVNAVAKDAYAIGYGGVAYGRTSVKELSVRVGEEDVPPTAEHVKSGKYPLTRDLFFYLRSDPTGDTKKFVDYVLSPEGQKQTLHVGYFEAR